MVIQLTIKNTFFNLVNTIEVQSKRSSSLPRSWKPVGISTCGHSENPNFLSDVSTADSDGCSSVEDHEASRGAISSGASDGDNTPSQPSDEQQVKTVLDLSHAIMMNSTRPSSKVNSMRLSSKARLFQSVSSLPADLHLVLMTFCASYCGHPKIVSVSMSDSISSGTILISASYRLPHRFRKVCQLVEILSAMKMALLEAAAKSTSTYILGYENQPFVDGPTGFSGKLGTVPVEDDTTCWDTYQKGYCPRPWQCRWSHPRESDFANVVVDLSEE